MDRKNNIEEQEKAATKTTIRYKKSESWAGMYCTVIWESIWEMSLPSSYEDIEKGGGWGGGKYIQRRKVYSNLLKQN